MPVNILMPALSPTMAKGNLTKWLKKDEQVIKAGDVIAEIETDKAIMEVEAVDKGILKILVPEGTKDVEVNQVIGLLLEQGEEYKNTAIEKNNNTNDNYAYTPQQKEINSQQTSTTDANTSRIKISPLAKRLATQNNIPYSTIKGSGPLGRIIKQDITRILADQAQNKNDMNFDFYNNTETIALPISNIRRVIANRLTASTQAIPHFYLTIEAQVDKLLDIRGQINQAQEIKISINDFIIKICAMALVQNTEINRTWGEKNIIQHTKADISIAVPIEDGLITPIIKDADKKNITTISSEVKKLIKQAQENKLAPVEFQGGNFTLSNLGMYGIKNFHAIINPPQSSILSVGAIQKTPVVIEDKIKIANIINFTLACDHRVIDGAIAAKFLQTIKTLAENPLKILI